MVIFNISLYIFGIYKCIYLIKIIIKNMLYFWEVGYIGEFVMEMRGCK